VTPERKAPAGTITGPTLDTTWQTPPELLEPVRAYFGGRIPLDAATATDNPTGADRFFARPESDGLTWAWSGYGGVFCNPPYGRVLRDWLDKMRIEAEAGAEIISLLPSARWEQAYFQRAICAANALCMIRKRVAFVRAETRERVAGNPYANIFVGWNVDHARFAESFGPHGACVALRPLAPCPENVKRPAPAKRNERAFARGERPRTTPRVPEAPAPAVICRDTLDLFGDDA
jgi:hypothetical protein